MNIEKYVDTIEDYVGGNIETTDEPDRMSFTVFLHATLTAVAEEARRNGYEAGLADGTGKPLLAIEQIREEAYDRGACEATTVCNDVIQKAKEEARGEALEEVRKNVDAEISSVYGMLLDEFCYTGLATEEQWNSSVAPAFTRLVNVVFGHDANAPTARVHKYPRDLTK